MDSHLFHPPGLIIRKRSDGEYRFAMRDPTNGREVVLGSDWDAAYGIWLDARAATTVVPKPIPVRWLITEFGERHRPWGERERRVFGKEMRLLVEAIWKLGDPSVADLRATDCETVRATSQVGPVKTETLVRRLRQIWGWANTEGLTDTACPWVAKTQERQVRAELVELVARYLAADAMQRLRLVTVADQRSHDEGVVRMLGSLSAAVRLGARNAILQAKRDGRPDLIPALRRCELSWFLEPRTSEIASGRPKVELVLGHARIDLVRELRTKAQTRQRIISESNVSDQDVE
jgi:hypothetical protein